MNIKLKSLLSNDKIISKKDKKLNKEIQHSIDGGGDSSDDFDGVYEWSMKLGDYLKLNNLNYSGDDLDDVKKSLKSRRENGGCSMWKKVGIPFLYKHNKDHLTNKEIQWYESQKYKGLIDE